MLTHNGLFSFLGRKLRIHNRQQQSRGRTTSGMIHFESDAPHLGEPLTNEGIYRRLGEPGW